MRDKTPVIYGGTYVGSGIEGREFPATDGLGSLNIGRPVTDANLKVARQRWPELRAKDLSFNSLANGYVDRSGAIFDKLLHDPVFAEDAKSACDAFVLLNDGVITFLRARGVTLDEIEADRDAAQRRADDEAAQLARFRAKQKQTPLRLSDLPDSDDVPSFRAAAAMIESLGGRIERDDLGQLVCSIPERTLTDTTGHQSIIERSNRQSAARAAQVLRHGERVVLDALERVGKNESLSSRLPDEVPFA